MASQKVEVNLSGFPLVVPLYKSEKETQKIVNHLNTRIAEIASRGGKVSTQAYALTAAYECAVEMADLRADLAARDAELLQRIEAFQRQVQDFEAEIEAAE